MGASASGLKADQSNAGPSEFSTTADPVSLDAPVRVPRTRPTIVTVADDAQFGNAPSPYADTLAAKGQLVRGRHYDPGLAGDAISQAGPAVPPTDPAVPNDIVTLLPSGDTSDFNTINAGSSLSATVALPDDIRSASLDLYAVGQATDEFWWGLAPAFREIEVSVDGKPAGVVWPDAFVYTGGVNPLIWRPLTGVDILDIPSSYGLTSRRSPGC